MLVKGLLRDRSSLTYRAVQPDAAEWSLETSLLARLVEDQDTANRLFYQAHGGKGAWEPLRIPRPGVSTRPKRIPLAAFLAAVNHGRSR